MQKKVYLKLWLFFFKLRQGLEFSLRFNMKNNTYIFNIKLEKLAETDIGP